MPQPSDGKEEIGKGERRTAWMLLGAAVLLNVAGYVFGLWAEPVWFDEVVHGVTLFALTLGMALYLYGATLTGAREHALLLVLTVASVGLAVGALWEVAEWFYDQWLAEGDAILGKWDTVTDLIADTLGSLAAGVVLLRMLRR